MAEREIRRLAAIMMLDVAGFSRMMAEDETGTLARVLDLRRRVIEPLIARHQGRVVKLMGDGALVEFASVTSAVECAMEVQDAISRSDRAAGLKLRIGINLGEVIADGEDIYGDGVNVASRIEALAAPGGVTLTEAAFDQLHPPLSGAFEDGGKHEVRNIPNPVRVFHMRAAASRDAGQHQPARRSLRLLAAGVALTFALALAGWIFGIGPMAGNRPAAPPAVAGKPSIAVLPFENLSGEPQQAYFSDGIAESLITDLSRISGLLVIARNTTFSFRDRGEAADPKSVGAALGVRYVVQGSVQKSGDNVRISANLVDARSGYQVWAGRIDRRFADLFALQDEVTAQIIDALEVELTREERRLISKRYTGSLEAYDLYLRAWEELWRFNAESRITARTYLNEALRIDPGFALAKAQLATTYTHRAGTSLIRSNQALDRAFGLAQEAVAEDPDLPQVQSVMGVVYMFRGEYDKAHAAHERALQLDPNFADAYAMQAWNLHFAGASEQALQIFEYAFRLNPRAPFPYVSALGEVHFSMGNYETAARYLTESLERNPTAQRVRLYLAATFAQLGRLEDARWEIGELLLLDDGLTLDAVPQIAPYKEPAMLTRLIDGLRMAGMPE